MVKIHVGKPIGFKIEPHTIKYSIKPKWVFGPIKRNCYPIKNEEPSGTILSQSHVVKSINFEIKPHAIIYLTYSNHFYFVQLHP